MTTYHRRKAAGLCPLCGLVPPQQGLAFCSQCRGKEALRKRAQQQATLTPAVWRVHEALRRSPYQGADPLALRRIPGAALLHCGAAWPITPGHVACGACGMSYTEEPHPLRALVLAGVAKEGE